MHHSVPGLTQPITDKKDAVIRTLYLGQNLHVWFHFDYNYLHCDIYITWCIFLQFSKNLTEYQVQSPVTLNYHDFTIFGETSKTALVFAVIT